MSGSVRDALLDVHRREREAHLTGDAALMASCFAEQIWEAGRGQLTRISRTELEQRFGAYFESVRYSLWDDLQPPHVVVSGDGRQAWMAIHIEARLAELAGGDAGRERAFESAWIAVYERHGDDWLMVGISSSVVDR